MVQLFSPEASEALGKGWSQEGGLETSSASLLLLFLPLGQHFRVRRPWEVHFGAGQAFLLQVVFES